MVKCLPAFLLSFLCLCLSHSQTAAQGCVGVRNMQCASMPQFEPDSLGSKKERKWMLGLGYRYFKSYKHFVGDDEQKQRVELGTEVINISHAFDLNFAYDISYRLVATVNFPVLFYHRSSLYEHYGNSTTANPQQQRFGTNANGLGDIRLGASYWMLSPSKKYKGNVALGIGIKLPTGQAEVQDDFHRRKSNGSDSITRKPVDQSIQLGDAGFGFTVETQGYQKLFKNASLYYNGFYLFNPRNTNNTLTRGTLTNSDPLIAYLSVPDQFSFRLGMNYAILPKKNLKAVFGGRIEGIPAHDAIGKSEGFRRPGYIVSLEPGVNYSLKNWVLQCSIPFAVYRNRTKSVYDQADPTGSRHGDAAFADYLVNFGVSYRF
ncbi:MAG: hypothetical protein WAU23_08700 [Ferruginibacter sp.]